MISQSPLFHRFALTRAALLVTAPLMLAPLAVAQTDSPPEGAIVGEVLKETKRAEAAAPDPDDSAATGAQETTAKADPEADRVVEAIAFARQLTDDATAALLNEDASEADKLTAFQAVLSDGLAVDTIGRFMIGDSRKTMSEAQTARYQAIFPAYITRLYADQFADIVGRPLEVVDTLAAGRRDVIVRTRFNRDDGAPINVDWRVRKLRSGDHKAIDIIVSGVSIMLVKREEFSAFIRQNGIDALIDKLETDAAA